MPMRIQWDKYEAAILLEATINVLENKILRNDAVKAVSDTLRKIAIHKGLSINSIYRNENGISMQMSIITALLQEKKSGLHNASKLFSEMVELYHNDYDVYMQILGEAKSMSNDLLETENVNPTTVSTESKVDIDKSTEVIEKKADQEYVLDFNAIIDMSYTRPVRFEFCNELYNDFTNWTQLYTKVLELLYKTNQKDILSLCGKNIYGNGRIEITDTTQMNALIAPKSFADGLYVETNLSARDIAKKICRLLEICGFSVNDMIIYYEKKTSLATIVPVTRTIDTFNRQNKSSSAKEDFFDYLINIAKLSQATARSYSSQVNTSEKFATENSIGSGKLYNAENSIEACDTAQLLLNSDDFLRFSRLAHNAPFAAVTKYYEYLTGSHYEGIVKSRDIQKDFANIDFDRYKEFLSQNYMKGFRLNDRLSIKRLRIQWQKTFNEDLQYDDETICKHILHITIRHGDMAYLPEAMLSDKARQKLMEHITTLFAEGKTVIYYEALYKEFAEEFAEGRINNVDMLKTYLAYINNGKFYLRRSYIAADANVEADNKDEVRSLMISHGAPMHTDDIVASLSHIAKDKVMWVVAGPNSSEFVRNKKGEYFQADIIEFTQNEMDLITEWIRSAIDDKVYMGGKELVDTINQKLPSIKERYPFLTWLGLRDVVAYKLRDVFSFNGKIISAYGENLSMSDVFSKYAMKHEYFTLTQLNMLKDELDTPIYYDSLFKYAVRINENEFVSKQRINFDISATDDAIEQFCQGEFISLKDVSLFGGFPDVSFPWNHFLLQQFVAYYSKKFMLLHNGFNAGKPVGAIVKRSSQIDTFNDVIIRVLADSNIPLNSENALQYLSDTGYIARKSCSNIDTLLSKANIYRANKGE